MQALLQIIACLPNSHMVSKENMMKIKLLKTLKAGSVAILMITGTGFINASYADEAADRKGDFLRGAQSWANNCIRCHGVRDPKELRDDQWITTSFHMRIRAGLTGQEVRDIIKFLQTSN